MAWLKWGSVERDPKKAKLWIRHNGHIRLNAVACRMVKSLRLSIFIDHKNLRIGFKGDRHGSNMCVSHSWIQKLHKWMKEHMELPPKGGKIDIPVYEEDGMVVASLPPKQDDEQEDE